jgi:hypothetical protein
MYTQDFIDEVKELYPTFTEMHVHAEQGNSILGRYLDDNASIGISIDKVLLATSLNELQAEAKVMKRRIELYGKWFDQMPKK